MGLKFIILAVSFIVFTSYNAQQSSVPYYNFFDNPNDTTGWNHYAISGTDSWQMGVPNGNVLNSSYSLPSAWVTNLNGNVPQFSVAVLETPYFDLSDLSINYVLSFYHKCFSSVGGMIYKLEYSIDNGDNWELLLENVQRKNWQVSTGFQGSQSTQWRHSAISLSFIQGQDSVKFRFKNETQSHLNEGWIIDNFTIAPEYFNVIAEEGDTIINVNKYYSQFTVKSDFVFHNQWTQAHNFTSEFYFSEDDILDEDDLFLGEVLNTTSSSINNWSNTFDLPPNLNSGLYYIFYKLDVFDVLAEDNENDNINRTVLQIDSIITAPYINDFENDTIWNNIGIYTNNSAWVKEQPNNWHIESAHSGVNSWITTHSYNYNEILESPFIDLSESQNTSLCFWFNYSFQYLPNIWTTDRLQYALPVLNGNSISNPYFNSWITLGDTRKYGYDCHCVDISYLDGELSTKFIFRGDSQSSLNNYIRQSVIDDIYIGEKRPDLSIESEKLNLFTKSESSNHTLHYLLSNSGLLELANTNTKFYFSYDTIFDPNDIFLGEQTEAIIQDTSYLWSSFEYEKPDLNVSVYYVFYFLDSEESVLEMREYNNVGFFEVFQENSAQLPYENDFEDEINGWRTFASLGEHEWTWGEPTGEVIDFTYSGNNAWLSNGNQLFNQMNRGHLLTPIFDLTELNHPVIEFDLYNHSFNNTLQGCNIMYSIDGGSSWHLLDTTSSSFKRWYYRLQFSTYGGTDGFMTGSNSSHYTYGKNLKVFLRDVEYKGRDYDDSYHYVIDIGFLSDEDNVKFMFVYGDNVSSNEGVMLDNFTLKEREVDLMVPFSKNLLLSSNDVFLRQNLRIKNNNNYISTPSEVFLYLSEDSLAINESHFLGQVNIPVLKPYENFNFNIEYELPLNFQNYNFLTFVIDPDNLINESNEMNNIHSLNLNIDSCSNFSYPIIFDFESDEIDGWRWYHDSSGIYTGHRYRVLREEGSNWTYIGSRHFALDRINPNAGDVLWYPIFSLESPTFNFTDKTNIRLSFDFMCIGVTAGSPSTRQGGTFQYSLDGGVSWNVLTNEHDPNALNWFNVTQIGSIGNLPGWTLFQNWTNAKYNLSFLSDSNSVMFRYYFRSKHQQNYPGPQGFKLDNFEINADNMHVLPEIQLCFGDSVSVFGEYKFDTGVYTDTVVNASGLNNTITYQTVIFNDNYHFEDTIYICPGDSYESEDGTLFEDIQNSFFYILNLQSDNSCDSILERHIIVDNNIFVSDSIYIACLGDSIIFSDGEVFYNVQSDFNYSIHHDALYFCDSIINYAVLVHDELPFVSVDDFELSCNIDNASYQWLECDNFQVIENATDQFYTPNENGNYAVIVTKNNCVDTSDCVALYGLSVDDLKSAFEILIFPNPTNGEFKITSSKKLLNVNVDVYNLNGQIVYSDVFNNSDNLSFNLTVESGCYFLYLKSDNEQVGVFKVIIN